MNENGHLHITDSDYDRLKRCILRLTGIAMQDGQKLDTLSKIHTLQVKLDYVSLNDLMEKLDQNPPDTTLKNLFIDAITNHETYWFRDQYPYELLKETLIPAWCTELTAGKRDSVHIWSAACATGQEAFSIVMTLLEYFQKHPEHHHLKPHFHVLASDISISCILKCQIGRYDEIAMSRGLSKDQIERYFSFYDGNYYIDHALHQMVTFTRFNLLKPFEKLNKSDCIFCRHILMYFSQEYNQEITAKIAQNLTPKGVLITGTPETPNGYEPHFEKCSFNHHSYYRRQESR